MRINKEKFYFFFLFLYILFRDCGGRVDWEKEREPTAGWQKKQKTVWKKTIEARRKKQMRNWQNVANTK